MPIELFRKSDLLRRNWTESMVRRFCPEPHAIATSRYGSSRSPQYFMQDKIEEIEQTAAWKADRAKIDRRHARKQQRHQEAVQTAKENFAREKARMKNHLFVLPAVTARADLITHCKLPPETRDPDASCMILLRVHNDAQINRASRLKSIEPPVCPV
jgi:hypothetical protein